MSKLLYKEDYTNLVLELIKHDSLESCLNFYEKEYLSINVDFWTMLKREVNKQIGYELREIDNHLKNDPKIEFADIIKSFPDYNKLKKIQRVVVLRQRQRQIDQDKGLEILDNIPLLTDYILHDKKEEFAKILKENFKYEIGKDIRIMIDYLKEKEPPMLSIPVRGNYKFWESLTKYFDRDVGAYTGIFDKPVLELIKNNPSAKKPIIDKINFCLSLVK
jgi:hypothetical protein